MENYNPFNEIKEELQKVSQQISELREATLNSKPKLISFPEFCKQEGITRPTLYSWIEKKLVTSELRGGRRYIINDGSTIRRYQRELA